MLGPVAMGPVAAVSVAVARHPRAVVVVVCRTNGFLGAAVVAAANPVVSVEERRSLAHPPDWSGAGVGGTGGGVAVGGMGGGAANIA